MKKRIISLLLVLTFMLSLIPSFSITASAASGGVSTGSEAVITVEEIWGNPGKTVVLNMVISKNPGILGATITVSWDEDLTLVADVSGEAFNHMTYTSPSRYVASGTNFVWFGNEVNEAIDGTILTLTFKVAETAQNNDILPVRVSYTHGDIIDQNDNDVTLSVVDGHIRAITYQPGDVTGDGRVNARDLVRLSQYISDGCKTDSEGYNAEVVEDACDVTGDGRVNARDLIKLSQYISDGSQTNPDGYNAVLKPAKMPECQHTNLQETPAKAATCTEDGNVEYWYCDECGKYFSDADGKTEIAANETVLAQTGHIVVIDAAVSPTYDSTGLTEGSHCSKCGKILKNQDVIPKLEATYHSIIYKDTKGAEIPVDKMRYSEHEGLLDLPVISADGYTFKGWYTASEGGTKVDHIIKGSNEDKVLYAHWELVKYTITYKDAPIKNNQNEFTIEDEIVLNDPEWFGLAFKNWTDDNGNVVTKISKGTIGNITITANWMSERNLAVSSNSKEAKAVLFDDSTGRYYIIYDIGTIENIILSTLGTDDKSTGETLKWNISETVNVENNVAETVAKTVSTSISRTDGWSSTLSFARRDGISISSSITAGLESEDAGLKAKLEATISATTSTEITNSRAYGVSGSDEWGDGTSDSASSTVSYKKGASTTIGKEIIIPGEMPKGKYSYVCAGTVRVYAVVTYDPAEHLYYVDTFSVMEDNMYEKRMYDAPANTTANITSSEGLSLNIEDYWGDITAHAQSIYTVQYDANGGEGTMLSSVHKVGEKSALQSNSFSRAGYVFTGWGISSNGGALYPDNSEITDIAEIGTSITLYAIWSAKKYKVILDVNNGDALYPDTYDVTYDATYGTLPSPVRAGYSFDGWYLGDEKIDSKSIVKIAGDHTLKAEWTEISYLVRFDAMGGSVSTTTKRVPFASTYGELPVASREGYKFKGWFTDSLYGNEITSESATRQDCDPLPVTLYAKWEPIEYMVKIWASDCCSMPYSYKYDQDVILSWSEVKKNQLGDGWNFDGWYYGETMFDYQQFISRDEIVRLKNLTTEDGATIIIVARCNYNGSESPTQPACITENTLITLADGSQVAVKDLTGSEELLVWNMITGTFDSAPILFIDSDPTKIYEVITLTFSDNTTMEVISEHGFFDINLNCYVYLDRNASQYIGHWFNKLEIDEDGMFSNKSVQLVDVKIINKVEASYSPITYEHFCYYTNGLLSMPGGITGFFNIFSIDDDVMKYNEKLMKEDIDKYGLFTYEEFFELVPVPKKIFDALGGKYLKVSIGKGLITVEKLIKLAERYQVFFEN